MIAVLVSQLDIMYRNFGQNRSRFSQDRNSNFSSSRDHDRRNWRDNRPRNDGYGSDSEYRRDNNFRNDNQNRDNSDNSRFQNSNNSSNRNFSSSLGAENVFSTPDNTFNVPSIAGTPIQQQYQNLFTRSVQQNVSTPENQQNQHQNQHFVQPQVPVNNFNYVPGNLNHVFNSVPSMNHHLNSLQANYSGISIAPVAKVPTFSPVSNQHSSNFNSFKMLNSSANQSPVTSVLHSPSMTSRPHNPSLLVNTGSGIGAQDFMSSLNQPQNYQNMNTNTNRNFSDQHRATLQSLLHMDKELLELYNCLRQVKPKDSPCFQKVTKMGM